MGKKTKREILMVSGVLGASTLLFFLLGKGVGAAFTWALQNGYLQLTYNVYYVVQMLYSVISLVVPFAIGGQVVKKIQNRKQLFNWEHAEDQTLFYLSIAFGFLALILANVATSILTGLLQEYGVTFDDPELPMPTKLSEYIFMTLASVIVPAFTEEFAFRGVILHSFRKYGDLFAVGMSALLFACMHGNMTQMPFALILGFVMGLLVVCTDSIWTGIAIHLFNNTYALVLTLISDNCSQSTAYSIIIMVNVFGLALGLIASVRTSYLYRGARRKVLYAPPMEADKKAQRKYHGQAWLYSLISLPMLASVVYLIVCLYQSVHTGGAA